MRSVDKRLRSRPRIRTTTKPSTENVIALANYTGATLDPKTLRDPAGPAPDWRRCARGVTGELYNIVAQRLKMVAPCGNTVVVAIANGKSVGYIPSRHDGSKHALASAEPALAA
jgi:hypothetical protein